MVDIALSKNKKPIRLTDERWAHITEGHGELANLRQNVLETVSSPDKVVAGNAGELLATKEMAPQKFLVVVYRELEEEGFIITAFLTSRIQSVDRRKLVWP